ncbi:MAG: hypothetical protein J6Z79_02410 [Clostridia bacterium]|nr:hypothetical protein [Clostridia bacterium]
MMKRRALALLLAALTLVPVILVAGCGKDDGGKKGGPAVVAESREEEDTSRNYDAKIHDMHGHQFWFIVRELGKYQHLTVNEIYAEELNGDKVNDAVFKRNAALQEKFNCEIREDRVENPASAVKEQLLAGEYQYDFIYTGVSQLRPLSASNLLVDFKELEEVNLEKAWWDQNAIEGLGIAGKAFYVTGEAGTMDERSSWIMYFNKDVLEKAHIEMPYDLVREGKWTIDQMYEIMMATHDDLDGDGTYTIGKDRFGYIGQADNNWFHVAAGGLHLSRISSAGEIEIPATVSEEVLTAWTALKPLLTSEYRDVADSGSRFRLGLGTFYSCLSGSILNMNKSEQLNFGVLPMPKLSEEQEDYWTSFSSTWCYGYAIPVTTDNATDYEENGFSSGREQAGYFLEAFSYYSMGTLAVAYYEQVIKGQTVKDADSIEMMDIALKNKVYDPVVIFSFGKLGSALFISAGSNGGQVAGTGEPAKGSDVNYDTLVSLYESRVTAARKALKNYINYVTAED